MPGESLALAQHTCLACMQVTGPYLRGQNSFSVKLLTKWAIKFLGMLQDVVEYPDQQVVVLSQVGKQYSPCDMIYYLWHWVNNDNRGC